METKKRLIDLIECLERCSDNTDCESCSRWLYPCDEHCVDDLLATAAKELKKLVDAVEVVRCKDCKSYMAETEERCIALKANPFGWCLRQRRLREADHREIRDANDFCSYGERRTNEN